MRVHGRRLKVGRGLVEATYALALDDGAHMFNFFAVVIKSKMLLNVWGGGGVGDQRYIYQYLIDCNGVGHIGEAFEGHTDIQFIKEII